MNHYRSPEQLMADAGALVERYEPGESTPRSTPLSPLDTITAASFSSLATPQRAFLDEAGLLPCRNVTMLSGDGGTGKSLLAMQLAAAVATTSSWLGLSVNSGKVLYLSAEDDRDETHIRLKEICAADGLELGSMTGLEIAVLAGHDAVLGVEAQKGAKIELTPLFERLRLRMAKLQPTLLVLDNLADVFAGNENIRPLARQFIGLLRSLALEFDCAVLLLSHPSLSGINSGSGTSGNTAWNNSVRSRLYLVREADEADPDRRTLQTMKTNYGPTGGRINMRWADGRFICIDRSAGALDASSRAMQAERVFLHLLRWHAEKGINVSLHRSPSFAPTLFARHPQAEGLSKERLETAMVSLLDQDRVRAKEVGPPSKRRHLLLLNTQ